MYSVSLAAVVPDIRPKPVWPSPVNALLTYAHIAGAPTVPPGAAARRRVPGPHRRPDPAQQGAAHHRNAGIETLGRSPGIEHGDIYLQSQVKVCVFSSQLTCHFKSRAKVNKGIEPSKRPAFLSLSLLFFPRSFSHVLKILKRFTLIGNIVGENYRQ